MRWRTIVMVMVMVMVVITICSYLSDQQYQNIGGRSRFPPLHDTFAPFQSFQSQTRSPLFLHIGAPGAQTWLIKSSLMMTYLISYFPTNFFSTGDNQSSCSQGRQSPGKVYAVVSKICNAMHENAG